MLKKTLEKHYILITLVVAVVVAGIFSTISLTAFHETMDAQIQGIADAHSEDLGEMDNQHAKENSELWKTNHPVTYKEFEQCIYRREDDLVTLAQAVDLNNKRSEEHKLYVMYRPGSRIPIITDKFLIENAGVAAVSTDSQ